MPFRAVPHVTPHVTPHVEPHVEPHVAPHYFEPSYMEVVPPHATKPAEPQHEAPVFEPSENVRFSVSAEEVAQMQGLNSRGFPIYPRAYFLRHKPECDAWYPDQNSESHELCVGVPADADTRHDSAATSLMLIGAVVTMVALAFFALFRRI